MWRLLGLILILLGLFERHSLAHEEDGLQSGTDTNNVDACETSNKIKFWDTFFMLPVQFVVHENNRLTANFASPIMLQKINLWFPSDSKARFFGLNGDWEEELNRKSFLKKIKNDFWMITYRKLAGENILCEAHQFKNWGSIRAAYGQSSDNLLKTVETMAYWGALGVRPLYFHIITENEAHWLSLSLLEGPESNVKNNDLVKLENGTLASRLLRTQDGSLMEVLDHGILKINRSSVFHIVETKMPRKINLPATETYFTLREMKIRAKPIDLLYFTENGNKHFWLCSFDKETKVLLRVLQIPEPEKSTRKK